MVRDGSSMEARIRPWTARGVGTLPLSLSVTHTRAELVPVLSLH